MRGSTHRGTCCTTGPFKCPTTKAAGAGKAGAVSPARRRRHAQPRAIAPPRPAQAWPLGPVRPARPRGGHLLHNRSVQVSDNEGGGCGKGRGVPSEEAAPRPATGHGPTPTSPGLATRSCPPRPPAQTRISESAAPETHVAVPGPGKSSRSLSKSGYGRISISASDPWMMSVALKWGRECTGTPAERRRRHFLTNDKCSCSLFNFVRLCELFCLELFD